MSNVGSCAILPGQLYFNNSALKNSEMRKEIWKDVKGYEGLYQVSNLGRVKSLPRETSNACRKGRILKQFKNRDGYVVVSIYKNAKIKTKTVHRMIADVFIKEEKGKDQINHINGIKHDNRIENLERSNNSLNQKHAFKNGLQICRFINKHGAEHDASKAVSQYDKQGNHIADYESQIDAMKATGIDNRYISACCRGINKTARGYIWQFKE